MNYRHIYHAGNFADVFKHIVLTLCLEKLHEKPAPFFVLDTHAGIAKYDLSDEKSLKTFEAEKGIKKLLKEENFFEILPSRYLTILAKLNRCEISELPEKLNFYSGSPIIIKDYLRARDRAIFAELNREDFQILKRNFAGNAKFSLSFEDGFHLLRSKLPPLEKRGLIIIDPAFEKDQSKVSADYDKIIQGLVDAHKRFAHGIYLVWYPIIKTDAATVEKFQREMSQLKFEKTLHVIFDVGSKEEETKMTACGMFIFNAPWQLDKKLKTILAKVLEILQQGDNAKLEIIG
ncbi:MAG: 23S rRNA (adenine(2030)-N(6))-methyltransferase RlmJ [Proteobacteria bacterium]|nr:23S rRNA (adenine(2030)-N(6))-methyltransferase RlmJ [Pseudomonadota bacterium]